MNLCNNLIVTLFLALVTVQVHCVNRARGARRNTGYGKKAKIACPANTVLTVTYKAPRRIEMMCLPTMICDKPGTCSPIGGVKACSGKGNFISWAKEVQGPLGGRLRIRCCKYNLPSDAEVRQDCITQTMKDRKNKPPRGRPKDTSPNYNRYSPDGGEEGEAPPVEKVDVFLAPKPTGSNDNEMKVKKIKRGANFYRITMCKLTCRRTTTTTTTTQTPRRRHEETEGGDDTKDKEQEESSKTDTHKSETGRKSISRGGSRYRSQSRSQSSRVSKSRSTKKTQSSVKSISSKKTSSRTSKQSSRTSKSKTSRRKSSTKKKTKSNKKSSMKGKKSMRKSSMKNNRKGMKSKGMKRNRNKKKNAKNRQRARKDKLKKTKEYIRHAESTGGVGCFSAYDTVATPHGIKTMTEIREGDKVLCFNSHANMYSMVPIKWFIHREPEEVADFVTLTTDIGFNISLTSDHLIPVVPCESSVPINPSYYNRWERSHTIQAKNVRKGQCLIADVGQSPTLKRVIDTRWDRRKGIFAPLTNEGSIVVNGIHASCFSGSGDVALQQSLYNVLQFVRSWMPTLLSQVLNMEADNRGDLPYVARLLLHSDQALCN